MQTDRHTDRHTDGPTDRRTDGRTNGRTDGRTNGRTDGRTVGRTDVFFYFGMWEYDSLMDFQTISARFTGLPLVGRGFANDKRCFRES